LTEALIRKLFLIFLLCITGLQSPAQLLCAGAHSKFNKKNASAIYHASVVDRLNAEYNNYAFHKKLADNLKVDPSSLEGKSLVGRAKSRWNVWRLRSLVAQLKDAHTWGRYDFEYFAFKLEQFSFLMDPSVIENMSPQDKIDFRTERHSMLVNGLENFFFEGRPVSKSMVRKFLSLVTPLFTLRMPKLFGVVYPPDLSMEIAWKGRAACKEKIDKFRYSLKISYPSELAEEMLGKDVDVDESLDIALWGYETHANASHYFNLFSTYWNRALFAAVFGALPLYTAYAYHDAVIRGEEQTAALLAPIVVHSTQMAQANYDDLHKELKLERVIQNFPKHHGGREPTEIEKRKLREFVGLGPPAALRPESQDLATFDPTEELPMEEPTGLYSPAM
jgi:hypothetical protein